jgi:hypothetical protein
MLVKNVPSELYIYFFDTELQRSDDSIVCLAHACSCLSKYNKLIHKQKLSMNSLNVCIHFSEEIVSKLYQWNFWTDTIFKLKTRIKSIQNILSVPSSI